VVRIPPGTTVATVRTETEDSINFTTVDELAVVPCSLQDAATIGAGKSASPVWRRDALERGDGFACFTKVPVVGDAILVGLTEAVPGCAVTLRFSCRIEGVGVDPNNPPLRWEAWSDDGWVACDVESDETGGLNRDGDIILHVPRTHAVSVIEAQRAVAARRWSRRRLKPAWRRQPSIRVHSIGGWAQSTPIFDRRFRSVPGQRYHQRQRCASVRWS
jgi:hypothetical protein